MHANLNLTVKPSPLRADTITHAVRAGRTIIDILEESEVAAMPGHRLAVEIDGNIVGPERWEEFKPLAGSIMTAVQLPMEGGGGSRRSGGKDPVRTVATIAVIAAAAYTGGAAAGLLGVTGTLAGGAVSALTATAVTAAGTYAVNKLFPPPGGPGESRRPNSATGQRNELRPFLPIPVVLGTVRMSPPLAAIPYTNPRGDDLILHSIMTCGLGLVNITDIRIGDTPIAQVEDVQTQILDGSTGVAPTFFRRNIVEQNPNVELEELDPVIITTEPDTVDISIDVFFPEGIADRKKPARVAAGQKNGNVIFEIAYRPTSGGPFVVPTFGNRPDTRLTNEVNYPKRINYLIENLTPDEYEVRITRQTPKNNKKDGENRMLWTALRSVLDGTEPIIRDLSYIAIRANIDGALDNINCLAEKLVPTYTGTPGVWSAPASSSNPAALFRYLLQGAPTARPVPDAKLDLASIEDFYDHCAAEGFTFNGIFEDFTTLHQRCLTVLAAGRATLSRPNGLYGVTIDRPTAVPVAMISPRNSRDFTVTRVFESSPEALRVRFLDASDDFKPGEVLVYADGFDENNVTSGGIEVLDLTNAGLTTSDLAYRFGRFEIAKRELRLETYSVVQGLDQLVLTQGDLCKLQHDTLVVGNGAFRITSVSGTAGNVESVTVDGDIVMEAGNSYVARIRYVDDAGNDQLATAAVDLVVGTSHTLTFSTPFSVGSTPAVDDILFFGQVGLESIDAIVRDIRRIGDFEAELTLFEAAPGVHTADQGPIPPYNPQTTVPGRFYERPPALPEIQSIYTRQVSEDSAPSNTRAVNLFISIKRPPSSTQPPRGYLVRLRLAGDDQFTIRQQFSGSSGVLEVTGLFPGKTYEFQVQALGTPGQLVAANSNFTSTQSIKIPVPSTSTSIPDQVAGLELEGQGNDTEFIGRDATFVWRYTGGAGIFSLPTGAVVGQTTLPGSTGFVDQSFSHFEVTIFDPELNEIRRVEEITTARYTYTYAANVEDGIKFRRQQLASRPARRFEIRVATVDRFGGRSPEATLTVENPPPAEPLGVRIGSGSDHFSVKATFPADPDATNLMVWSSGSSGFTPDVDNLVASVAGNTAIVTTSPGQESYIRVAFADAFSADPSNLNLSSEFFSRTLAAVTSPPKFAFEGIVFSGDPVSNQVSWTAGTVTIDDQGVTSSKSIPAGSATFSGASIYIYFEKDANQLLTTTVADAAVDVERQILAIYDGGAAVGTANGDAFIDGARVVAQTILGASIAAGQITTDLIAADAVQAQQIAAGAVTADKLTTGELISDSAQLGDLVVGGRSIEELAVSNIETNVASNEVPNSPNTNENGRWHFVVADTIESVAKPTFLLFNCICKFIDTTTRTNDYFIFMRVFRNGIQIKNSVTMERFPGSRNTEQFFYLTLMDIDPSPPSGTNNYELQIRFTNADSQDATGNGITTVDRQLWIHQVKK